MASDGTALGSRMKKYETATGNILIRYLPYVIRVDVRAAHSLLRGADKPFDMGFVRDMGHVAQRLCDEIQGAVFAYQQSDEISVLVCSYEDHTQQPWFDGRVQKIASVTAGIASATLALLRQPKELPATLAFDSRVFALPNAVEAANYFVWRQRDAQRNSVAMAAQARFSTRELYGKNREQMIGMLAGADIDFERYPSSVRFGQVCLRNDTDTGHYWRFDPAPQFEAVPNGWLARHIPPLPSFEGFTAAQVVRAAMERTFPPEVLRDLGRPELFHG